MTKTVEKVQKTTMTLNEERLIQLTLVFLKSTQNPLSINDLSIRGYENAKKCSLIDPYYVKKTPCFQYKIK